MKDIRWFICVICGNQYSGTKDNGCTDKTCSAECTKVHEKLRSFR